MPGRLHRPPCPWFWPALGVMLLFGTTGARSQHPTPPPGGADPGPPGAEFRTGLLDINTATAAELRALPGMGVVYARRVVDGRPYTAKNQLLTRGVLPPGAYQQIRDQIVAHRAVRSN